MAWALVAGISIFWATRIDAGLSVYALSSWPSKSVSKDACDGGTEDEESVRVETFRLCCCFSAASWARLGCFLRKTFLGCLELSMDRLESAAGAEAALTALAEALPEASLVLEFPGRP